MSNTFLIRSRLVDTDGNSLFVDVAEPGGPPPVLAANLDLFTQRGKAADPNTWAKNQLWTAIADSAHPGYFVVQSLQADQDSNPLVIDIQGVTEKTIRSVADGTPLDANKKHSDWNENQLWTVVLDPQSTPNINTDPRGQVDSVFIQSYLKNSSGQPLAMDVKGWRPGVSVTRGQFLLDARHQESANADNQRWQLVTQGWPSADGKITKFVFDLDSTDLPKSSLTVVGGGIEPATTIVCMPTIIPITRT